MSDDRMHHITVRINKDSYVGRKVLESLEQMKRSKGMSYNACIQESILMMSEGKQGEPTDQKKNGSLEKDEMGEVDMFALIDDGYPHDFG